MALNKAYVWIFMIKKVNELIHPDDRHPAWEQVQQALAKRLPFRLVYRIQTATGQEKWVWEQGQGNSFSYESNYCGKGYKDR